MKKCYNHDPVATVSLWISQIPLIVVPAYRLHVHVVCITLDILMWSQGEGKPICKLTGIKNRSTHDNGLTFNLRSSSDRTIVVVRPTQRRGWRPWCRLSLWLDDSRRQFTIRLKTFLFVIVETASTWILLITSISCIVRVLSVFRFMFLFTFNCSSFHFAFNCSCMFLLYALQWIDGCVRLSLKPCCLTEVKLKTRMQPFS